MFVSVKDLKEEFSERFSEISQNFRKLLKMLWNFWELIFSAKQLGIDSLLRISGEKFCLEFVFWTWRLLYRQGKIGSDRGPSFRSTSFRSTGFSPKLFVQSCFRSFGFRPWPIFVQPVLVQSFSSNPVFVHLFFVHGLFSSKHKNKAGNSLNAVECEPVPTRVLNPNASETSYKPKQRR